jgi:hypothetical protein
VTDPPDTIGAEAEAATDQPRFSRRRRWWLAGAAFAVVLVVGFFGITGATGLHAPGWLERYKYSELSDLAAAVNAEAGDLRTADDCWRTVPSKDDAKRDPNGPLRDIARVDFIRSRVVLRVYANESGKIDQTTYRAVIDRLDAFFAKNSRYSWDMLKVEPSPDGWSPLVSCRLVTRGWITGF